MRVAKKSEDASLSMKLKVAPSIILASQNNFKKAIQRYIFFHLSMETDAFDVIPISHYVHLCPHINDLCHKAHALAQKFFSLNSEQKLLSSNLFGSASSDIDVGFRYGKSRNQELYVIRRPFGPEASFPWPITPTPFASVFSEYFELLERIGREIVRGLASSATDVEQWGNSVLFLRAYRSDEVESSHHHNNTSAVNDGMSHTDSGTLTVLFARTPDDIAGLEFLRQGCRDEVCWVPAESKGWTEPSFLVFGGEGLTPLRNGGTQAAAVHRVVLDNARRGSSLRVTMPFQLRSDCFHSAPTTTKKFMMLL
jgi:isopenicillin N synthase-like dioxygenase